MEQEIDVHEWKIRRASQMKMANRRLPLWLVVSLLSLVSLHLSRRQVTLLKQLKAGLVLFFLAAMASFKPAPRVNFPHDKLYWHWPILGKIGWLRVALSSCPTQMLIDEAIARNFQVGELGFIGGTRDVFVYDQEDVDYVLRKNWSNYTKNSEEEDQGLIVFLLELTGRGIFTTDGKEWRDHRKVASVLFTERLLSSTMSECFNEHGESMAKLLASKAAGKELEVDVQAIFSRLTFDTISSIAFGEDPNALQKYLLNKGEDEFLVHFDRIQWNLSNRFFAPETLWKLLRLLNLGWERQISEDSVFIREHVEQIVRKRLNSVQSTRGKTHMDLLSLYIDAALKASDRAHLKEVDYLADMVMNYMVRSNPAFSALVQLTIHHHQARGERHHK